MYSIIIQKIKDILKNVKSVKSIYAFPLNGNPKTFPAVIFYPASVDNVYSDNGSNHKNYKFKIFITVDTAGTTVENAYSVILPNVVDQVIQAFDTNWSHQIDNHRAWLVIDSGIWGLSQEEKSLKAFAELSLTYQVANDV